MLPLQRERRVQLLLLFPASPIGHSFQPTYLFPVVRAPQLCFPVSSGSQLTGWRFMKELWSRQSLTLSHTKGHTGVFCRSYYFPWDGGGERFPFHLGTLLPYLWASSSEKMILIFPMSSSVPRPHREARFLALFFRHFPSPCHGQQLQTLRRRRK